MFFRGLLLSSAAIVFAVGVGGACGCSSNNAAPTMVGDCAALARLDLRGLADAPTTIDSATLESGADAGAASPLCRVMGHVAPQVKFDLRLPPPPAWNQKFLMGGCGGYCGSVDPYPQNIVDMGAVTAGLQRNYAVVTTDTGHCGSSYDASWALNDSQAVTDYAYRGVHVVALASSAIISAFYGSSSSHAYFDGCSNGGRQGLIEAQRYPQTSMASSLAIRGSTSPAS
jgi:feruloyl esterase